MRILLVLAAMVDAGLVSPDVPLAVAGSCREHAQAAGDPTRLTVGCDPWSTRQAAGPSDK